MTPKRDHERTRELLAGLSEAEVPAVLHLLTCEDCYAEALRWLAERVDLAGDPGEEKAGAEDLLRLEWKAPGLVEAFARQRAEDQALLRELLGLSPGERARTVTRDSRFQSERLAELTLSESERLAATDPGRAEELARLTFTLAVQLAARIPPARADSLRARACSRAADALRRARRREESDASFRQAAVYLRSPMDAPDRALFARLLARLRAEQGRIDEASALLDHAAGLYGLNVEDHERGLCLAELGFLHLEEGDAAGAFGPLVTARKILDAEEDPANACRVRLALALCLVVLARGGALELVREARELYPRVRSFGDLVRFYWLEGRVSAHLGNLPEAVDLLEKVRGRLLKEGDLYEAALATLDLALLLARDERVAEIHPLIHELSAAFSVHPGADGALVALSAFEAIAAAKREDLEKAAEVAGGFLRRLSRGRARRLE
ncbi:MAG TPA: hypothetical protein VLB76_02580 [Thermoanaerobaculia bacterium]|nr:hypothetical protein [Thermoanaerobaculia bacterium]